MEYAGEMEGIENHRRWNTGLTQQLSAMVRKLIHFIHPFPEG